MLRVVTVFVVALAFLTQDAPAVKTGTIAGEIVPPAKTRVTRPVRVALLNETYTNMYDAEALHRLDEYWEDFKPAFVRTRELFYEVSQVAQTEAIESVLVKMRREGVDLSRMLRDSTPDGRFEFRNVPLGEYKVVAFGSAGAGEFVWQGWLNLESAEPVYVQLKTTLP